METVLYGGATLVALFCREDIVAGGREYYLLSGNCFMNGGPRSFRWMLGRAARYRALFTNGNISRQVGTGQARLRKMIHAHATVYGTLYRFPVLFGAGIMPFP